MFSNQTKMKYLAPSLHSQHWILNLKRAPDMSSYLYFEMLLAWAVRYDVKVIKSSQFFTPLFSQKVLMDESPRFTDSKVKWIITSWDFKVYQSYSNHFTICWVGDVNMGWLMLITFPERYYFLEFHWHLEHLV